MISNTCNCTLYLITSKSKNKYILPVTNINYFSKLHDAQRYNEILVKIKAGNQYTMMTLEIGSDGTDRPKANSAFPDFTAPERGK